MQHRRRRIGLAGVLTLLVVWWLVSQQVTPAVDTSTLDPQIREDSQVAGVQESDPDVKLAREVLESLPIKGRAPKTGYKRSQFGDGWQTVSGCDTRNIILNRDLMDSVIGEKCKVISGVLHDPYTSSFIQFVRGADTSDDVQIDHVVALSNAWQTGAQQLSVDERIALANDPLELLAVDGRSNQAKGDGDAATWLPANKSFRCQYVARQVAVKSKYRLWVTQAEKDAIARVLSGCPDQTLPIEKAHN